MWQGQFVSFFVNHQKEFQLNGFSSLHPLTIIIIIMFTFQTCSHYFRDPTFYCNNFQRCTTRLQNSNLFFHNCFCKKKNSFCLKKLNDLNYLRFMTVKNRYFANFERHKLQKIYFNNSKDNFLSILFVNKKKLFHQAWDFNKINFPKKELLN